MNHSRVVTIKPSWRKAAASVVQRFTPFAIVLIVLQFWLASHTGVKDTQLEVLPLLVLVLAIVADYIYRMTTAVKVESEQLSIHSFLTSPHVIPRSEIRGVALRRVSSYRSSQSFAVIIGENGRSLATLPEAIWEEDDLRQLQAEVGSKDHSYRQVTRDEYRREFPGATRSYLGWILALVVLIMIFAAAYFQTK
jgi:hypothetical protein